MTSNRNEPMDDKLNPAAWVAADPFLVAAEAEWWANVSQGGHGTVTDPPDEQTHATRPSYQICESCGDWEVKSAAGDANG